MRAKSEKRLEAERLRRELGLSYREIEARLGVNKSTLSGWLKGIVLPPEHEARLQERLRDNRAAFAARALPVNRERHQQARQAAFEAGARVAQAVPDLPIVDELAVAMLYLAEGSKTKSVVELANMDPAIVCFFVWALKTLYNVADQRIAIRLHLVEAARPHETRLIGWWRQKLGCLSKPFRPSQFDRRSHATHISDDYYGVCTVTCNDTYLLQRILGVARTYIEARMRPVPESK